ncbi:MAG: F0F1 ATP synthase subunit delta [Methylobacterium sp.]|nr:F0F1 ATP synthase subunit delta [Methylobacterium sp.]
MAETVTIARPYAVAVFRLAKENKALPHWSDMLALASGVVTDARMRSIIDDPNLTSQEVERLFLKVCGDKLDAAGGNLVRLLIEYDRLSVLPDIAALFEALKAQDEGSLDAEFTTAVKLEDAQVKTLVAQLQARFGKKIEASVKVDPEIIGGIKIVVGDTVIDASVRGRLQELAYTLKG